MPWRERLGRYMAGRLPSATNVEVAHTGYMPAGASNDTIALDLGYECDGHRYALPLVLRPQRADGILAPYDVERQFKIMRALAGSDVPVPAVAFYETDDEVMGAPFYLMERVQGETLPLFWYGGASPRLASVAEMLATIHSVDWRGLGLEFLLPAQGAASALECDLAPWRARAAHAGLDQHRSLLSLGSFLARNEPGDTRHALLHGDPNPGNYLLRGNEVAAVLDWEVAAIGDPRSDLGFYAALLTVFGGMPGKAGRTLLSDAYEQVIGRPLDNLAYYEAVGLYKVAIVMSRWAGHAGLAFGLDTIARRLDFVVGPAWAT
jgi:aminoglycoside phosphotransferase (APT) family kinase protein